ncbi:Hyaluronan synthase 1 [Lasiodiplodia hormozganensis]|uniref:Hyaluronan synthase 1 n=1 Tax=Lasiodiplodia hormozganensis TaxID=869390 RepID=A0AA39XP53_9PEZI|nr:Hyaluronan synthase 1 [Lasiodiplodia hormozganensis]
MQMVDLAESVCGATNVSVIELDEPFGAIAARMIDDWKVQRSDGDKLDEDEFLEHVFGVLVRRAAAVLQDFKLLDNLGTGDLAKAICITQPHVSKKDIMFTAFLFTLAIARAQDIPFIWSSDSDSYLDPTAAPVHRVLTTMAADPAIAGSCGALQIHNAAQSTITRLVSATYWTDLALTSGQNSAFDVTDCQPGPCAAFTTNALSDILLPWYTQTFLGVRPIVNEDRHLSTLLLSRGYRVTFHPAATVMTDAPSTFATWIVQQVRWSRAIVLETIAHPRVLTSRNPMFALYALRRIAGPYLQAWIVIRYLRSGAGTTVTSPADITARMLLCSIYTATRRGAGWRRWPWLCASQVFLQFPQPPIVFWASATFLDGTWGNEAQKDNAVKEESALKTLLQALINTWAPFICVSVWVGMVAAVVCKFSASIALVGSESVCAATGGIVFSIGMLYVISK